MNHKHDIPLSLEKQQIARQFSRAAMTYDQVSQLQQAMSAKLISRISATDTGWLVDFGCGTGASLAAIARSRTGLTLAGLDLAPGMIDLAREKLAAIQVDQPIDLWVADLVDSRLSDQSIDILFSNAAMQWSSLHLAVMQMHRVLKPGGKVLLSTFGPSTLTEIQTAWQAIGDSNPRVHSFTGTHEIRNEMVNVGFEQIEIESEIVEVAYPSALDLFKGIKHLGATNADRHRCSGLLGKEKFQKLCQWIDDRRTNGRFVVRFEPIYIRAQKA